MAVATIASEHEPTEVVSSQYSVFTRTERWFIVGLVAYAACFSTLSSFIYFPAIDALADSFSVSTAKINLCITCYMAVATVAPTFVGMVADVHGRRLTYVSSLGLYVGANIGMALAKSYRAHLGLRIVQALAISGTFSVAYGVITDISSPAERGSYANAVSFAITIAPSIGPILGGGLTYLAGWAWIFWFLSIASGGCLIMIFLFLPETCRNIVGNGSMKPPVHLTHPVPCVFRRWRKGQCSNYQVQHIPNPLKSLIILSRKDNATITFACGLLYTVYSCLNASLSVLFINIYHLNQWQAGLIYLPFGVGGMASTFVTGRFMNAAYRRTRTELGMQTDCVGGDDLESFSVEKARLRIMWLPMIITCTSVVTIGWVLQYHKHMSIPLCIQFVAGFCMQADFSIYNTLLVDKNHKTPAAAQASSNLVRCTMAAITIAFLQNLLDKIGIGWTFTLMAGLCFVALGCFYLDYHKGTAWRLQHRTTTEDDGVLP